MRMPATLLGSLCVAFIALGANACSHRASETRTYKEIASTNLPDLSVRDQKSSPGAEQVIRWDEPKGWRRVAASRMVLAAYHPTEGLRGEPIAKEQLQITFSTIESSLFDLRKNVVRWLGQINLELGDSEVSDFLGSIQKHRNKFGLEYSLVDTRRWRSDRHSLVAVFHVKSDRRRQLFVKMMGDKGLVEREASAFKSLLRSVRLEFFRTAEKD